MARHRLRLAVALAVRASRPAARPAKAILQLLLSPANTAFSGHLLLGILDPADELVAGERRDVLPGIERRGVADQRTAQIPWKLVDHAARHTLAAHRANPMPTRSSTSQSRRASEGHSERSPRPQLIHRPSRRAVHQPQPARWRPSRPGLSCPACQRPPSARRMRASRSGVSRGCCHVKGSVLSPLPDPGRRAAEYASTSVLYRLAIVATASISVDSTGQQILKGSHPDAAAYGESRIARQGRCDAEPVLHLLHERVASEDNAFGRTVGLGSHCSEDLFGSLGRFVALEFPYGWVHPAFRERRYRLGGQSGSGLAIEVELILVLRQLFTCRRYEQFEEPAPAGLGRPGRYLREPLESAPSGQQPRRQGCSEPGP